METNTPKEFFDTTLPFRFKPEKAKGIDVTTQINVTGVEGGNRVATELSYKKLGLKAATGQSPLKTKNSR